MTTLKPLADLLGEENVIVLISLLNLPLIYLINYLSS